MDKEKITRFVFSKRDSEKNPSEKLKSNDLNDLSSSQKNKIDLVEKERYGLEMWGSYRIYSTFVKFRPFTEAEKKGYNKWSRDKLVYITEQIWDIDKENVDEYILAREIFNVTKYKEPKYKHWQTTQNGLVIELSKEEFDVIFTEFKRSVEEHKKKRKKREKEKKIEAEKKLKELQTKALLKAKETKKDVIIRTVGGFDGDEVYGDETGWVNIYEVATPMGKIIEKEYPSY